MNNNFYNCESCQDEPKINCEDCEIPFVICHLDGKIYQKDCIQIKSPLPFANISSDDLVETFDDDNDDDIEYLKSLPKESDHHNISDNDREEMFLNFINEMPEGRQKDELKMIQSLKFVKEDSDIFENVS